MKQTGRLVAVFALAAGIAAAWRWGGWLSAAAVAACIVIVTAEWVLPWYVILALPFAALARRPPAAVVAAAVTALLLAMQLDHYELFINAKDVLPQFKSYYNYSGSLSTPPCSEGVRWFVLKEPVFVSQGAIDHLHAVISQLPGYNGFRDNNRPVRPLNGRVILNRNGR